jgi:hypothetical protein
MPRRKARVYKLRRAYGRYPWICILRTGTFGAFRTWEQAIGYLEYDDGTL